MNLIMDYGAVQLLEDCLNMSQGIWKGLNKSNNFTYKWRIFSLCALKPMTLCVMCMECPLRIGPWDTARWF